MKLRKILPLTIIFSMMLLTVVFGADQETIIENANTLKIFTLVPPLVAISLAFITKNVIVSLFVGILSGTFILSIINPDTGFFMSILMSFIKFINFALNSLADPWNAGIILQVLTIGGLVHIVGKMGGARAVAEKLSKKAKTPVSAQLITWLLGILVFFDDYANALIVGPIMMPIYDKMKISREKLAFVVDATAAPIAGIALISTWIGYEIGLIQDSFSSVNMEVEGYTVFLQTLPFRFYNIFMLIFVVLLSVSLKDFGPMLKAQKRTNEGDMGKIETISASVSDELSDDVGDKASIWNAIIPLGTLIIASLLSFYFGGYYAILNDPDSSAEVINVITTRGFSFEALRLCFGSADASVALFQSAVFASIVAISMAVSQKIFTIGEAVNEWVEGMKTLLITAVILILAWSLSGVIKELGSGVYISSVLSDTIPYWSLPTIIFLLGSIISFSTGTSYGTMGILMPLTIPLAVTIWPDNMSYYVLCTSAVLTGAIFGDHCSPISDTTILSSTGSGCNHIAHVNTQMPYAIFVGSITIFLGYLPAAFGVSPFILIPLACVAMFGGLQLLGKKI